MMFQVAYLSIESAAIDHHTQLNSGEFGSPSLACPGTNATLSVQFHCGDDLGCDGTKIFTPNAAAPRALLKAVEFDLRSILREVQGLPTRAMAHARAVSDSQTAFHRVRNEMVLLRPTTWQNNKNNTGRTGLLDFDLEKRTRGRRYWRI